MRWVAWGRASQARLAKEFDLTAASMSTMTKRLLDAGLIERRVDEREIRSNVLRLSNRGKSLLEKIYTRMAGNGPRDFRGHRLWK